MSDTEILNNIMKAELDTIKQYNWYAAETKDEKIKKLIAHIVAEEQEHHDEAEKALSGDYEWGDDEDAIDNLE
jgi:rubrerythrin